MAHQGWEQSMVLNRVNRDITAPCRLPDLMPTHVHQEPTLVAVLYMKPHSVRTVIQAVTVQVRL